MSSSRIDAGAQHGHYVASRSEEAAFQSDGKMFGDRTSRALDRLQWR
jgi:hypothetical protein